MLDLLFDYFVESKAAHWIQSPVAPVLHVMYLLFIAYLVVELIQTKREKRKPANEKCGSTFSDLWITTTEHLMWANKVFTWIFNTSEKRNLDCIETWIEDLNVSLAKQNNHFSTLVVGLKDGSVLPRLLQIKSLKEVSNEIHAEVLLKSIKFGFLVTVYEDVLKSIPKSYSATVTAFQCWFTVVLERRDGHIGLLLKPKDRKPSFRLKMKALSNKILKLVLLESVGYALQRAVLQTQFFINLTSSIAPACSPSITASGMEIEEEEMSCCSGTESEDDADFLLAKIHAKSSRRNTSNSPGAHVVVEQRENNNAGISRAASKEAGDTRNRLATSRPNNRLRTPPHKAASDNVHFIAKQLLVKVLSYEPYEGCSIYPTHCLVDLDYPHQKKNYSLPSVGKPGRKMLFNLNSKSSLLTVNMRESSDSKSTTLASGDICIRAINMDKPITINIPLKDEGNVETGLLSLALFLLDNKNPKVSMGREEPSKRDQQREVTKRDKIFHKTSVNQGDLYGHEMFSNDEESQPKSRCSHRHQELDEAYSDLKSLEGRLFDNQLEVGEKGYSRLKSPKGENNVYSEGKKCRSRSGQRLCEESCRRRSKERKAERNLVEGSQTRIKSRERHCNIAPAVDAAPLSNREVHFEDELSQGSGDWESPTTDASEQHYCPSPAFSGQSGETKITKVTRVKGSPTRIIQETYRQSNDDSPLGKPDVTYNVCSVPETALKDLSKKPTRDVSPVTSAKISITTVEETIGSTVSDAKQSGSSFTNPTAISSAESDYSGSSSRDSLTDLQDDSSRKRKYKPFFRTRSLEFDPNDSSNTIETFPSSLEADTSLSVQNVVNTSQDSLPPVLKKKSSSMNKLFSRMSRSKKVKAKRNVTILEEYTPDDEVPGHTGNAKIKRSRSFKEIIRGKKKHKY